MSPEVLDNGGRARYRAAVADRAAWSRAGRPKATKLALRPALAELVTSKLELDWSPQQIAGWLKIDFPDDGQMQVPHESIYRSLLVQARGSLRKERTKVTVGERISGGGGHYSEGDLGGLDGVDVDAIVDCLNRTGSNDAVVAVPPTSRS